MILNILLVQLIVLDGVTVCKSCHLVRMVGSTGVQEHRNCRNVLIIRTFLNNVIFQSMSSQMKPQLVNIELESHNIGVEPGQTGSRNR